MNLRKKSYLREALAEEAKGNYREAAGLYAKAEEFEKVGEMYELTGNLAHALPKKISAYQQALHWYKRPEHIEPLAEKLATALEVEIRAHSAGELERLAEVAEYYALAKQWEKAGKIYAELGRYDQATAMYIQGGAIERVEQAASQKEDQARRRLQAQQSYEEGVAQAKIGQRDKAVAALEQCLNRDAQHAEAQTLLNTLSQALQPREVRRLRIPAEESEYLLCGRNILTIGRKEDNDIILTQLDVSRRHARIGLSNRMFFVEDSNSSNGTRLNGLKIQKTAALHDRDVIGFGLSAQFEVRIRPHAAGLSALLRSLDGQRVRKYAILFAGELLIGAEKECDLAFQPLMPVSIPHLFKLKYAAPYWYLSIHPHLVDVEFNGTPVSDYVIVTAGDAIVGGGVTLLFD